MITRHHQDDRASSTAVYSDCERYRYALTRTWDQSGPKLLYIMLNPSKATEVQNDPTIERCERRASAGELCLSGRAPVRELRRLRRTQRQPRVPR